MATISKKHYDQLKTKYSQVSSWASWISSKKPDIGDTSHIDALAGSCLHNDFIFIGLNLSRTFLGVWKNFHDTRPLSKDGFLAKTITGSGLEGAYMLDIIRPIPGSVHNKSLATADSEVLMKQFRSSSIPIAPYLQACMLEILEVIGKTSGVCSTEFIVFGKPAKDLFEHFFDQSGKLTQRSYSKYGSTALSCAKALTKYACLFKGHVHYVPHYSMGNNHAALWIELTRLKALSTRIPCPRISYGGNYSGIMKSPIKTASYDPFIPSASFQGFIYFKKPGPTPRCTRFYAFDKISVDSEFSVSSGPVEQAEGTGWAKIEVQAVGDVEFKPGIWYPVPASDPNASLMDITVPHGVLVDVAKDGADNWYIRTNSHYSGNLEYRMGLRSGRRHNAFVRSANFTETLPGQPVSFGIPELLGRSFINYHELVQALQQHFSAYQCCLINQLEKQKGRNAKITFMVQNKVGSCRHRAFLAYLVMESTGTKTRYVISKSHAWVECLMGNVWRYIDLGGCPVPVEADPEDAGIVEMESLPLGDVKVLDECFASKETDKPCDNGVFLVDGGDDCLKSTDPIRSESLSVPLDAEDLEAEKQEMGWFEVDQVDKSL